jgi:hypothetical protein
MPEPPTPWKALKMMSSFMLSANPHARENTVKIKSDMTRIAFLPSASLNLAVMARKPYVEYQ